VKTAEKADEESRKGFLKNFRLLASCVDVEQALVALQMAVPLEWFRDEFGDKVIGDQLQKESQFQLKACLRYQNYSYLRQKLICMMRKAFFPESSNL